MCLDILSFVIVLEGVCQDLGIRSQAAAPSKHSLGDFEFLILLELTVNSNKPTSHFPQLKICKYSVYAGGLRFCTGF
jgi:hypothetical protein